MTDKIEQLKALVAECVKMADELGMPASPPMPIRIELAPTGLACVSVYGPPSVTRGGSGWTSGKLDRALDMAIAGVDERRTKLHALVTGAFA